MLRGAIIDVLSRPEPLTDEEQAFADWAESRDLAVLFTRVYPVDDDDDFEPFLDYLLTAEQMVDDKIVAFTMTVTPTAYAPQLDVYEQLVRYGLEDTIARV